VNELLLAVAADRVSAGPLGLLIVVLMMIATVLLIRSMNGRITKLPTEFPSPVDDPEPKAATEQKAAAKPKAAARPARKPEATEEPSVDRGPAARRPPGGGAPTSTSW
jgi:hypothetical protein